MARLAWALQLCVLAASALCIAAWANAPVPSPPEKHYSPVPPPPPPPPKGAVDCSTVVYSMMDCLDFVSAGSNTSKPDESCCEGVKSVVRASPSCLCEALREAADMKIDLNMTRAAEMSTICKVSAPSVGKCGIADSPTAAPAPSKPKTPPTFPPPALPEPPSPSLVVPAPPTEPLATTGNATAPTPSHSGASSLPFSVPVVGICLAAATFLFL